MSLIKAKKSLPGIIVDHNKNTASLQTVKMPIPEKIYIPMLQNIGEGCEVTVKKGDFVYVGQKIGDSQKFLYAPIHSSVSGTVEDILEYKSFNGGLTKVVVIKPDGIQTKSENLMPPVINNAEDFISAVRESGVVGLGGAGFPTHVKLAYKDIDKVTTLVINGAECEPYITSDYRECIENPDDIIEGIKLVKQYLNIDKCYIGIEDNKKTAIRILDKQSFYDNDIEVVELKSKYPQGAEKVLIYSVTGKIIGDGQLPADCGVIVLNVTTVAHIARYIKNGLPLISKRVTVDGDMVKSAKNVEALIGTPIKDILEFCETNIEKCEQIIMGGPMMGVSIYDINQPIIKNNNGILAFSKTQSHKQTQSACIRCGRCARVCPIKLMPMELEKAYDINDVRELKKLSASLCMACGCCSYVCPANRDLSYKIQLSKKLR
jgi:electron transport complex protein RnfC